MLRNLLNNSHYKSHVKSVLIYNKEEVFYITHGDRNVDGFWQYEHEDVLTLICPNAVDLGSGIQDSLNKCRYNVPTLISDLNRTKKCASFLTNLGFKSWNKLNSEFRSISVRLKENAIIFVDYGKYGVNNKRGEPIQTISKDMMSPMQIGDFILSMQ